MNGDKAGSKKPRTTYSPQQVCYLEESFAEQDFPNKKQRNKIAEKLQLSESHVQIWFQNKRAKRKRKEEKMARNEEKVLTLEPPSFWPRNLSFNSALKEVHHNHKKSGTLTDLSSNSYHSSTSSASTTFPSTMAYSLNNHSNISTNGHLPSDHESNSDYQQACTYAECPIQNDNSSLSRTETNGPDKTNSNTPTNDSQCPTISEYKQKQADWIGDVTSNLNAQAGTSKSSDRISCNGHQHKYRALYESTTSNGRQADTYYPPAFIPELSNTKSHAYQQLLSEHTLKPDYITNPLLLLANCATDLEKAISSRAIKNTTEGEGENLTV